MRSTQNTIYIYIYPTWASSAEDWRTDITRNPLLLLYFWCCDHCLMAPGFETIDIKLKLKLKLTPFGIVHRSKGDPFQVHLTVSTCYLCYGTPRMMNWVLLTVLGEVER